MKNHMILLTMITGKEELNINFLRLTVELAIKQLKEKQYDKAMDVLLNGYNIIWLREYDILEPIVKDSQQPSITYRKP